MPAPPVLENPEWMIQIPQAFIAQHGRDIDDLATLAFNDLAQLLAGLDPTEAEHSRDLLLQTVPQIVDPYASAAAQAGASFYEDTRELAQIPGRASAATAPLPDQDRYDALVRWAAGPWFDPTNTATVLSLLAGGVQRLIADADRGSVYDSAARDDRRVGYQRVPATGCCAFCAMIASRGDIYASPHDAERVVGRGVPVEKPVGRQGGRRGGGIKARGPRQIGEKYHDYCRCKGVAVFESTYVQMQDDARRYYESYADAYHKVRDGLTLRTTKTMVDGRAKLTHEWVHATAGVVSAKKSTSMILAAMRAELGVA